MRMREKCRRCKMRWIGITMRNFMPFYKHINQFLHQYINTRPLLELTVDMVKLPVYTVNSLKK